MKCKVLIRPWTIRENEIIPGIDAGVSSEGYPMSALYALACVGFVVALAHISMSWAVTGVALCAFATVALCWLAGRPGP